MFVYVSDMVVAALCDLSLDNFRTDTEWFCGPFSRVIC